MYSVIVREMYLKQILKSEDMDNTYLILRYGELFLKGKNRPFFEKKVISAIQKITRITSFKKTQGRLIVPFFPTHNLLQRVFGLTSYSPAVFCEKERDAIKETALLLLQGKEGTFKVCTNRADKKFPVPSPEVNKFVGRHIEEKTTLQFALQQPQHKLFIEINTEGVYLFTEVIPCLGGLPVGAEGRALVLLETETDLLAGLLAMKRGVDIIPVSCKPTRKIDITLLQQYSPQPITLTTMSSFKEIEQYAQQKHLSVIFTGELLDAITNDCTKKSGELIILRPLVAYSSEDVHKELFLFKNPHILHKWPELLL